MSNFKQDLEDAKKIENIAKRIICGELGIKKDDIIDSFGNSLPFYDFRFTYNDKELIIEVKEDKMFERTGNVAIELSKKTGKSGLSITRSNLYIYFLGEDVRIIRTSDLTSLCYNIDFDRDIDAPLYNFRKVWGGDRNESYMCLIPHNIFLEKSIKLADFLKKIKI